MTYLEDLSKGLEVEGDVPRLLHRGDHVTEHRAAHSDDREDVHFMEEF